MTYKELCDEVLERSFPEGIAENLEAIYRKRVLDGFIEVQRWVPYFKERQFNIIPFETAIYRQGTTIVNRPDGKVRRVATYTNRNLSDIVYYDPGERNDVDRFLAAMSREVLYPDAYTDQVGYFNSDSGVDKGFRVERGIFCIDERQLWLYPHIESTEIVLIEWKGAKTEFEDTDIMDLRPFDAQVKDALSLYLKKEQGVREDRSTSDYVALTGRWREAVGNMKIDAKDMLEHEFVNEDIGELLRGPLPTAKVAVDYVDLIDTVTFGVRRIEVWDGEFHVIDSPLTSGVAAVWLRDIASQILYALHFDDVVYALQIIDGVDTLTPTEPGTVTAVNSVTIRDAQTRKLYDLVVYNGEVQLR